MVAHLASLTNNKSRLNGKRRTGAFYSTASAALTAFMLRIRISKSLATPITAWQFIDSFPSVVKEAPSETGTLVKQGARVVAIWKGNTQRTLREHLEIENIQRTLREEEETIKC